MSKITAVQTYKTSDGKEHEHMFAAEAHQMGIDMKEHLDTFLTEHGIDKAQAGFLRRLIPTYLVWTEKQKAAQEAGRMTASPGYAGEPA